MAGGKRAPQGKSERSPKRMAVDLGTKIRIHANMKVEKVYLQLHLNLVLWYQL
jgi:hypothetical protein